MGQVFRRAEQYLDQLDKGYFVEIGTSRNGDDGSTKTLDSWATSSGTHLHSVDIDVVNCEYVRNWNLPNTTVVNASGQEFLAYAASGISLLYLDNFDWDWHPDNTEDFVIEQQKHYKTFGLEMNNMNSQRAHLEQMILALPLMTEKSIVVCDDTWFNKWWGHYSGKSGAVVPFLLNNGYEVLHTQDDPEYGTILGRGIV